MNWLKPCKGVHGQTTRSAYIPTFLAPIINSGHCSECKAVDHYVHFFNISFEMLPFPLARWSSIRTSASPVRGPFLLLLLGWQLSLVLLPALEAVVHAWYTAALADNDGAGSGRRPLPRGQVGVLLGHSLQHAMQCRVQPSVCQEASRLQGSCLLRLLLTHAMRSGCCWPPLMPVVYHCCDQL